MKNIKRPKHARSNAKSSLLKKSGSEWQSSKEQLIKHNERVLREHKKSSKELRTSDFVPCLFFKGKSSKVMIHFHANGEDIAHT